MMHQFVIVGDEQNGRSFCIDAGQIIHQLLQMPPILAQGGFIQNEQARAQNCAGRERGALLLAHRKRQGMTCSQRGQVRLFQRLIHDLGIFPAKIFGPERYLIPHLIGEQLIQRILEKHRHIQTRRGAFATSHMHPPLQRLEQARSHQPQGGFASAIFAHQRHKFPGMNLQGDVMDDGPTPIARGYVIQRQHRRCGLGTMAVGLNEVGPGAGGVIGQTT